MELFYYVVFGAMAAVVAVLELGKSNKDRITTSQAFNSFKNNYILVYSLMMGMFRFVFFFAFRSGFNFSPLIDSTLHFHILNSCIYVVDLII